MRIEKFKKALSLVFLLLTLGGLAENAIHALSHGHGNHHHHEEFSHEANAIHADEAEEECARCAQFVPNTGFSFHKPDISGFFFLLDTEFSELKLNSFTRLSVSFESRGPPMA